MNKPQDDKAIANKFTVAYIGPTDFFCKKKL